MKASSHSDVMEWLLTLPLRIARAIRLVQWWDYKLVPSLSVFYATACLQRVSIASIWPAAIALLLAIASCAAYVSIVNDLTDRADDRLAGKANRMAGRPAWQIGTLFAAPLCFLGFFTVLWSGDVFLVAAYLGSWAAFSLYSIPPFRLKDRGTFGVIADACGSHVFPTLVAILLVRRATGIPIGPAWIAAAVVWALGYGVRGILWHQLYDFEADQRAGLQTFVLRYPRRTVVRLAYVALLTEMAGLAVALWLIKSPWPSVALLVYAAFAALKWRLSNVALVIAEPSERYSILGQEYYTLLLPLALLFSSALRYPVDWLILVAHLVVFPQPAVSFVTWTRQIAERMFGSGANSSSRDEPAVSAAANTSAPTLNAAIAKAAAFLRERLRSGSYGLAALGSDGTPRFPDDKGHVFVAWPIAEAMTGLLDEIDRTIILVRILSEEQEGGVWGYQSPGMLYNDETRPFLVDSDDSAFALRTLHRLGVNREPKGLMRFYREPERMFVTWNTPGATSLQTESALGNNFRAHPEVNANIYHALRGTHFEKHINYDLLLRAQDERGFWKSYFYPTPLYATLLVLDLTRGNPAFAPATERALAFIVGSQNADGSWGTNSDAYETALAVAALAGHEIHAVAMRRGVAYLLSAMAEDGSWASGACIWESHWNEQDIWRGYDHHRAFVSAKCLLALRRAAGALPPP